MRDNNFEMLFPDAAVALWRQGKDAWNAWVEKNPEYNICFDDINSSEYSSPHPKISFAGFNFPKGTISFTDSKFGNGGIDFSRAKFSDGDVYFNGVGFGKGDVNFTRSRFGDGSVSFTKAIFKGGVIRFDLADFGKGDITFSGSRFENLEFYCSFSNFDGQAVFHDIKFKNVVAFSFQGTSFSGLLDIYSEDRLSCLIDLTQTKISHHVSLHGIKCTLPVKPQRSSRFFKNGDWASQKIKIYVYDIPRARRLKELAEENKDHQAAQDFHVLEMQAKRVHSKCPVGYLWNTEFWYEKLSDYGRSVSRPLDRLLDIGLFYMAAYIGISYQIVGH